MRTYFIYIIAALFTLQAGKATAQVINWKSLEKNNRHIVNLNARLEHGLFYGAGYGYKTSVMKIPVVLTADHSAASGGELLDDFKSRVGVDINWVNIENFRFSTKLQAVFRRYENDYARLVNFGSDFSGAIGYYKKNWFLAGKFGFDKAIVTHFRHTKAYKDQYPGVVNGWYEPATGGYCYYGGQAGVSFGKVDLYLEAGKTLAQDFKTKTLVPMYGQLGFNLKF